MRDSLLHLIFYQGDTEFGSSEQQRKLIDTAPTDYDRQCLLRVMREEQRHGWQMCHVLITNFGDSGKLEAQKLLERRAYKNTRLLGAFNKNVDDFIDFVTYTCFIDRDGKYQLTMLHPSELRAAVAQHGTDAERGSLSSVHRSKRVSRGSSKPAKCRSTILQKYLNKWLSTGYDLFGKDRSSAAARFYRWGFKGTIRRSHRQGTGQRSRTGSTKKHASSITKKTAQIIESFNRLIPEGKPKLRVPDIKFNRQIGDYADKIFSIEGNPLSEAEYKKHLEAVLPGPAERKLSEPILKAGNWMSAGAGNA